MPLKVLVQPLHMTKDKSNSINISLRSDKLITYSDNNKEKILGSSNIGNTSIYSYI